MTVAQTIAHIVRDDQGAAWIADKNVKVIEVVLDHLAYGWSADAICEQHPHLSLSEVHSALAFYYDHTGEFDAQIATRLAELKQLRAGAGEFPMQKRLRSFAKPL